MSITRDKYHKRKLTGGKQQKWRKKRKHEIGRQPANTKIGSKHIAIIRVRGGNFKKRALALENGNFSWISLGVCRKTKIITVIYNASNNELVRTNTLVKSSIIYVDAGPFKNLINNSKIESDNKDKGNITKNKNFSNIEYSKISELMLDQIKSGKLLARICSRPGQSGRADGYILEESELEFYLKKIQKKKIY